MLTCDCETAPIYEIVLQKKLHNSWSASNLQPQGLLILRLTSKQQAEGLRPQVMLWLKRTTHAP